MQPSIDQNQSAREADGLQLRFDEFLNRIDQREDELHFNWLIGAGMCVTAGIPTAAGIAERVLVYSYASTQCDEAIPNSTFEFDDTPQQMANFFNWYAQKTELRDDFLSNLKVSAEEWLKTAYSEEFSNVSYTSSEGYMQLFEIFGREAFQHAVFSGLMLQMPRLNLAHLALAGLLKHFPKFSHTVFTTNFDDLLLRSLLQLGHFGLVYGNRETEGDFPDLDDKLRAEVPSKGNRIPSFPQIVHLHGHHTRYRLKNRQVDVRTINPYLQGAFEDYLRNGHLIVLGYSGWDDIAMRSLERIATSPEGYAGTLYWVPFKGKIEDRPLELLARMPKGRARIVVDPTQPLCSDSFMVRLVEFLNRDRNGFAPFRSAILIAATQQHAQTIGQLRQHARFTNADPEQGIRLAALAVKQLENGELKAALKLADEARDIGLAEDLQIELRAKTHLLLSEVCMEFGDYERAIADLESANQLFSQSINSDSQTLFAHNSSRLSLAECYLRIGKLDKASRILREAVREIRDTNDAILRLLSCLISARGRQLVGDYQGAQKFLVESSQLVNDELMTNDLLRSELELVFGIQYYAGRKFEEATQSILRASNGFEDTGDSRSVGFCELLLGMIFLMRNDYLNAERFAEKARTRFSKLASELGAVCVEHLRVDIDFSRYDDFERAIAYQDLAAKYRQLQGFYGGLSAICDSEAKIAKNGEKSWKSNEESEQRYKSFADANGTHAYTIGRGFSRKVVGDELEID